ncbi:MAG: hypothetical protein HYU52_05740 [Acidobacteria bacterium]|nr:hypothetical protein [Acidobacteriota bacterium]
MRTEPKLSPERIELLLRLSRRGLMVVLAMLVIAGSTILAHLIRPGTPLADWPSRLPWLIPLSIVFMVAIIIAPGGKLRWRGDGPEELAILQDELRLANLARAQRFALFAVLLSQIPLALLLSGLPSASAVMAMAVSSVTLGVVTLIASFLVLDTE